MSKTPSTTRRSDGPVGRTAAKPTCIDLFSGCGGFSLGFQRAGFDVLAAIDFKAEAVAIYRANFPDVGHAMERDLTKFGPQDLAKLIGRDSVDVIIGGPPCQGYSHARQRDGANSGPRMIEDHRRQLYQEFLKFVGFFRPKVFVMENVLGIRTAAGGRYFTRVQREAREAGYRVHGQVERAEELGVPQKRVRQLIIGTRLDLPAYFPSELVPAPRAKPKATLGEAIGDLPILRAGSGDDEREYDYDRRYAHIAKYGRKFIFDTLEVANATKLTAHRARPHSERDLRDFAKLREGESSAQAMRRGVDFEFPYDKGTFKDRYTRQHRDKACSTIVAHLSKDGLMFIHPTQNRSLTPREAARVQTFPDWFIFPVARTHQFAAIGNAVPPLVAEAIGLAVIEYMQTVSIPRLDHPRGSDSLPKDHAEAAMRLAFLIQASERKVLKILPADEFRKGWHSIAFLYPGLHPDGALEHGSDISHIVEDNPVVRKIEPRLIAPYFVQSGWPVALAPIADDAWRRYEQGELSDDEFYCNEALVAGIHHRSPLLASSDRRERCRLNA